MRPELAGLVHGAAELLPVSSSAHARALGATHEQAVAMAAGAAPVVVWLWRRDVRPLRPALQLAALTPPVVAGALLGPARVPVRAGLVAGSAALALSDRARGTRRAAEATWRDGLALGLAHAVALSPGVSRLGATLATARALGFARAEAASLAREVALPVTAAAVARTARGLGGDRAAARAAAASALGALAAAPLGRLAAGPQWPLAAYRLGLAAAISRRRA